MSELADEYHVSTRTILRDLKAQLHLKWREKGSEFYALAAVELGRFSNQDQEVLLPIQQIPLIYNML